MKFTVAEEKENNPHLSCPHPSSPYEKDQPNNHPFQCCTRDTRMNIRLEGYVSGRQIITSTAQYLQAVPQVIGIPLIWRVVFFCNA